MRKKTTKIPYLIRQARKDAGLTLRQLSKRAGTSHSTISAYESGTKVPGADVLLRLLNAAGMDLAAVTAPRLATEDLAARGEELRAVLELAEYFPARHHQTLSYPIFGRTN